MILVLSMGLLAFGASQDNAAEQARALVERLRSDKIEDRQEAMRALRALGRAAYPAVRDAMRDPDSEVASRAAEVFPALRVGDLLPPLLLQEIPEALEGIAVGKQGAWTLAFLEATARDGGRARHPTLKAKEFLALARPALNEALDDAQLAALCRAIGAVHLSELLPDITAHYNQSPTTEVGLAAVEAVVELGGVLPRDDIDRLLRAVRYGGQTRSTAIVVLAKLKLKEAVPDLIRVSFEEDADGSIVASLLELGERNTLLERARKILHDPPPQAYGVVPVRPGAAKLLGRLGIQEDAPLLEWAMKDADEAVARRASQALQALRTRLPSQRKD